FRVFRRRLLHHRRRVDLGCRRRPLRLFPTHPCLVFDSPPFCLLSPRHLSWRSRSWRLLSGCPSRLLLAPAFLLLSPSSPEPWPKQRPHWLAARRSVLP